MRRLSARRKRNRILMAVAATPLLVLGGWVVATNDSDNRPIAVAGAVETKQIALLSRLPGRVKTVFVNEGELVRAGTPLVEFDVADLEARQRQMQAAAGQLETQIALMKSGARSEDVTKARAAAQQAHAQWQLLNKGPRQDDIARARAMRIDAENAYKALQKGYPAEVLEQAKAAMEQAKLQSELAVSALKEAQAHGKSAEKHLPQLLMQAKAAEAAYRTASLQYQKLKKGPSSSELNEAKQRVAQARAQEAMASRRPQQEELKIAWQQYLQANSAYKAMLAGPRRVELEQAKAQLNLVRAQIEELKVALRDKTLYAPINAEVTHLSLSKGETVQPNKPVAVLTSLEDAWAQVLLPEKELKRIREGQAVIVRSKAYPKHQFHGEIANGPGAAVIVAKNPAPASDRAQAQATVEHPTAKPAVDSKQPGAKRAQAAPQPQHGQNERMPQPSQQGAEGQYVQGEPLFPVKIRLDNRARLLRSGMTAEVILPAPQKEATASTSSTL